MTRVVVALSGGVDSSVAAALLLEQGYEVVGMTLRLFACEEGASERSCCGLGGVAAARAAAGQLGIPHYVVDGQARFRERVLRGAWQDYATGRTPSPCVACNEHLKLGLLLEQADALDARFVATGHHARMVQNGRPTLCRGRDAAKDQAYFLFSLSPAQLARTLLPVGELSKPEVRELARRHGLPNAARAESQDACIAQRGDFAEALRQRFDGAARGGRIVSPTGQVLAEHPGIHHFTVGQRKGLGVALGQRAYVTAIRAESGEVVVSTEPRELEATGLEADDVRWHEELSVGEERAVEVQVRYRHRAAPGRLVRLDARRAEVRFASPQQAVTPGQAAVFYQGERVLGGGWIHRALPE
ncbi:MAG: tRNA 2-thiouridine(34) synthase MnmA [Deltaproteobacteria bacterium]|nr:tRNA 2-thiouridine(34) synthase MnmA [Deltaproteobacteria bacterium]